MESLMIETGLSVKDLRILQALVNAHSGRSVSFILLQAKKSIKNISVNHAIALGYLIGYLDGTEKAHSEIFQSISLCQRQN